MRTPLPAGSQNYGEEQTREESGEEWWFGHCNYAEADATVAYITAGYTTWPNCFWKGEGCTRSVPEEINSADDWAPNAGEFEQPDHRRGESRGAVAMLDLRGHDLWYRHLLPGTMYNAVQDSEGNIVVVGIAYSHRYPDDITLATSPDDEFADNRVIRWNNSPSVDMNLIDCAVYGADDVPRMGVVVKLNPAGEILWTTFVNTELRATDAFRYGSYLSDIVEVPGQDGPEYIVVGKGSSTAETGLRPMVARLNAQGTVIAAKNYGVLSFPQLPTDWPVTSAAVDGWFMNIAYDEQVGRAFVSGWYLENGQNFQAIGMLLDPSATDPFVPLWHEETGDGGSLNTAGGHLEAAINYTTGGGFVHDGNTTRVIWPIMGNFTLAQYGIYSGFKEADLRVHGFDLNGGLEWTTSLGLVRAYDLQSDMTATTDGKVAIVCSKWVPMGQDGIFDHNDLPPSTVACLQTDFGEPVDGSNEDMNWEATSLYNYWNTDAFVAKLEPADGTMLWCTMWDADMTSDHDCWPGDIKNQECMYKITEAPDGGLVVSGNTGHNFDDYYLAKLYPDCQSAVAYDATIANAVMNSPDRSYTVGANEFWTTDKNIHGTIIIPAGHSLTINNAAVIRFADSHQLEHSTRMLVEPGGKLLINGGAVLTSIGTCPNSMWDGIVVKGTNESQDGNNYADQGYAYVREATIENARTALITNNQFLDGDDLAAYQLQFAGGGVIRTRGATFRNNKRDVVMGPYENHAPNDHSEIRVNRSYFHDCDFVVDAPLNDHARPLEHMALYGVRNIPILGCDFAGTPYQPDQNSPMSMDAGLGMRGVNASFIIAPFCPVIVPYGEPCPTPIPSTFDRLTLGVEVAGITDDKTFSIDQAVFTRCPRSIRMDAVRDAAITNNRIDVADWTHPFAVGTPYGVYSDECTGYEIEDNAFTASTATDNARAGLVIKNSGPESNRVYNNTFDDFGYKNSTALLIQGRNANPDDNYLTGLEVKCNDFGQSGNKNAYDVALTGESITVRANQGRTFDNPLDFTAPAGNRFSLLGEEESDWHVANSSNFVVYYHHDGTTEPWVPQYFDAVYFDPELAGGQWPTNRSQACPSNQRSRDRERSGMMAGSEEKSEALDDVKAAYDATLDNGDTYSLMSYVGDPTKSSIQVRNALQSVAPKVSVEVWQVAFERSPAISPWNLTQALLSNSPLQPEVMKLCYESDLSDFYYNLVASAQSGINPLSIIESDISTFASGKAEDLTDLGRWSWLDSTNVDSMFTLLKIWHDQLPADNGDAVLAGYFSAKSEHGALYDLTAALEATSSAPYVYGLLKRYANAQQNQGWSLPDAATRTYITDLALNRWELGSARAGAWSQALGATALEEVVILPVEERAMVARKRVRSSTSNEPIILDAYPNPTDGIAYVVCNVPEGVEQATVLVHDLNGRLVTEQRIAKGSAILALDLTGEPTGVYAAELALDGVRSGTVKLTVQ